jgi:hypothetical protein
MVCKSLIFRIGNGLADPILSGIDSCNVHQFLQRKPKHLSHNQAQGKGVVPSLILIYRFEFLCVFYFMIALFTTALFTIQLKRKDGSSTD